MGAGLVGAAGRALEVPAAETLAASEGEGADAEIKDGDEGEVGEEGDNADTELALALKLRGKLEVFAWLASQQSRTCDAGNLCSQSQCNKLTDTLVKTAERFI